MKPIEKAAKIAQAVVESRAKWLEKKKRMSIYCSDIAEAENFWDGAPLGYTCSLMGGSPLFDEPCLKESEAGCPLRAALSLEEMLKKKLERNAQGKTRG